MRPEKIHLEEPGSGRRRPARSAVDGHVQDVVYLGSDTRYHVTLDAGGELEVIKQNVTTSSMEVLALKGRAGPAGLGPPVHAAGRDGLPDGHRRPRPS